MFDDNDNNNEISKLFLNHNNKHKKYSNNVYTYNDFNFLFNVISNLYN